MSFDLLSRALQELESAMHECASKLIIGGGFGLFLWQAQMENTNSSPVLVHREAWSAPRATADLDIFLETDFLSSIEQMQSLQKSLDKLGYTVIEGVKYLHFEKRFSATERVICVSVSKTSPTYESRLVHR